MPSVFEQLADAFIERKKALSEGKRAKSALPGSDYFMPESSKKDLANQLSVFEQGGLPGVLKEGAKKMYENPVVNTAISLTPGAGDLQSAFETIKSAKEGDWTSAGLNAVGILPFVPALKTVWHGSPHTFDKFDMSKIGTGEGAQAYGHGLYLADSPATAESYQKGLSDFTQNVEGKAFNPDDLSHRAALSVFQSGGDKAKAIKTLEDSAKSLGSRSADWAKNLAKSNLEEAGYLRSNEAIPAYAEETLGSLYKVDLPDEQIAKMLDWEKPLSEQPESVRNALVGIEKDLPEISDFNLRTWMDADPLASTWHNTVERDLNVPQEELAQKLYQRGVPGIQYFDSGSRGGGNGTRNYVVFSDEIPQILERNGLSVFDMPK